MTLHDGTGFNAAIVTSTRAPQAELEGAFLLRDVLSRLAGGRIAVIDDAADRSGYSAVISVSTAGSNTLNAGLMAASAITVPDNPEGEGCHLRNQTLSTLVQGRQRCTGGRA